MDFFPNEHNLTNKMHVYLQNGTEQQRWLIIQLIEGHSPRVAGLSNDHTHLLIEDIEPAIWFKVMVIEAVTIDCLHRVVHWSTGERDDEGNVLNFPMFSGDRSCYDFDDDMDELFDLSNYLIEKNPLAEPNEKWRNKRIEEYEMKLYRLLHCYILGKIMLRPRDINFVVNAFNTQNKSIGQLEDSTMMHSRLAEHYMSQMRNIREIELCPILESLVEENNVTKDLLDILSYDFLKAEPLIRKEVDSAQKKVDGLKTMLQLGQTYKSISHELAEARRARDQTHNSLVQLLMGKALIQMALSTATLDMKNKKADLNETCRKYMSLYKRVQEEKKIAKSFVDKKIRATSVRECIVGVLKELEKGREASGEEMTSDGQRITDVIDSPSGQWQTMSQQISSIVHNPKHTIGKSFTQFCQTLELNYRKALRSVEKFTNGSSSRFMTSFEDFYVISEQDLGLNKMFLEDQRSIILRHLYLMTELLIEHFANHSYMFTRKVRLCYEKCFFNRIGRDLILIYRVVYGKAMQTLEEKVSRLKKIQIDKLGLQMKAEWWLELFEKDVVDCPTIQISSADSDRPASVCEFGDDESLTDYESDEYCSDSDEQHEMFDQFKKGLKLGKEKVLSRSLGNLNDDDGRGGKDWVDMNTRLLKDDITESVSKAQPQFDKVRMSRYLEDEDIDGTDGVQQGIRLRRFNSTSVLDTNYEFPPMSTDTNLRQPSDSFDKHFGKSLESIRNIFSNSSPLKKMQCLTTALRLIASKVEELRMRGKDAKNVDRAKISVTAEDLLPLLVLILLKLQPHDVAKLYTEIIFVADLMAEFLSSGCHSYALCEFQIAYRVLDQTCEELNI